MQTSIVPEETILDLSHLSPLICLEIAAGLSDEESVRKKYEITEAQWMRLKVNPVFIGMMREAQLTFSGDANAGKRITKKAEILLEESLPILHGMMTRKEASSGTILDTVKQLTILAGRTQRQQEGAGSQGGGFAVAIHINTGHGETRVEGEILEHNPD